MVVQCYEQLASQGYIESRQGSGSFISDVGIHSLNHQDTAQRKASQRAVSNAAAEPRISENAKSMLPMWAQYRRGFSDTEEPIIDFQYGHVAVDYRLQQQLKISLKNQWQGVQPTYQHPAGIPELRRVIAKYFVSIVV